MNQKPGPGSAGRRPKADRTANDGEVFKPIARFPASRSVPKNVGASGRTRPRVSTSNLGECFIGQDDHAGPFAKDGHPPHQ